MRTRDPQSDLEPHGWQPNATATLTDAEEWTRAPTRRADAPIHPPRTTHPTRTDDAVLPLARPLTPADAVVAAAWRAARVGASEPLTEPAARIPVEPAVRPPTSGGLRAMPLAVVPATARHSLATPRFAPARDEDAAIPPLRQARRSYPTPAPTPWRVEALQAPPDVDLTALSTATAAPVDGHPAARFPALPDEAPARPAPRRVGVSTPPPAPARAPLAPPRPRHDSSDLAGAWPLLPGTRIPALRHAPGETERWPTLDDEPMRDDDGDELLSPAGHRERLAREQRGTPWNG